MRATSLQAFETVSIADRQEDVLRAMRALGPCTDVEIGRWLGWTINRVTPRRGELVKMERVEKIGTKLGPTGRTATVWDIKVLKPAPLPSKAAVLQQTSLF